MMSEESEIDKAIDRGLAKIIDLAAARLVLALSSIDITPEKKKELPLKATNKRKRLPKVKHGEKTSAQDNPHPSSS